MEHIIHWKERTTTTKKSRYIIKNHAVGFRGKINGLQQKGEKTRWPFWNLKVAIIQTGVKKTSGEREQFVWGRSSLGSSRILRETPHLEPCRPRELLLKDSPWLPTTSYASTKALHFIWNVRVFHLDVWSGGCCNRIIPLPWRKQTWKSKRSSREPKEAASPPHVGPRNGPPQAGGGDGKQRWSVVLLALSPSGSHLHSFHSLPGKMINSSSSWNFIGLGHRTG